MRVDGYVRVSRVGGREGDSFISPDVQREAIEGWAKTHGATILQLHVDLDESGGKIDRPAFQKALERIESKQSGGLVVAKLDRFARSLAGALEAIRRIDEAGAVFTSVAEGIDPTTPAGKMMHRLMLILAEFELDRITESWQVAQARAIARGVHFQPPFGYGRGEDGRLVPNEHARLVTEAFRQRAQRRSWSVIADWLNARSPTSTGQRWVGRTVTHVIQNRAYLGEAYHGKHRMVDAHPPLVTPEEFAAAQSVPGIRSERLGDLLLGGLVRCAGCRYRMKGDRTGKGHARIYRCRGSHSAGVCPAAATVTAARLDEFVWDQLVTRLTGQVVQTLEAVPDVAAIRQALDAAEGELAAFRDDLRVRDALGHESWLQGLMARAVAVDDARADLLAVRPARVMPPVTELDDLTQEERREIALSAIDTVFLRSTSGLTIPIADRTLICWRGEAPGDLPGPGRKIDGIIPVDWDELEARVATGEHSRKRL